MDKTRTSIDHRELQRRSLDKIRINNPFDDDRTTFWDGFPHVVKAHSYAIKERYIADKWLREQAKRIITERADNAIKDENKRRVDRGMSPMDHTMKTGEQMGFEGKFYAGWNTTQVEVIKEYGLYGGIAEEYGMDYVPGYEEPQKASPMTTLLDSLEKEPAGAAKQVYTKPETVAMTDTVDSLENMNQFQLRKMAKERGIATQKTDKKEDLIRQLSQ